MNTFFSKLALSNDTQSKLARHTLFWFVCWAFQGFIYSFLYTDNAGNVKYLIAYGESLIFLPQHMFLAYGIIYLMLPQYLLKGKYWAGFAGVLLFISAAALFSPLVQMLVIHPFRDAVGFPYYPKNIFIAFLGGLRGSMTVAGFAVAIKLLKHWYFKNTENQILEKEKLRAELELLKGQLHPHFMFNTLNGIYSLALKESQRTADAILNLSNLMRYMMSESGQTIISLSHEIEIIRTYILMEQNRFGDRLDVALNIQGNMNDKFIAPLILLPFVENGFKHGTSKMSEQAWMSLELLVKDSELKFKLINGKPTHSDKSTVSPSGIGLANVQKRLGLLYPQGHELRITEDDSTFIVSLMVQLQKIQITTA